MVSMSRSHGPLQPRRTAVRGGLLAFVLLLGACASGGGGGDGADADAPPDTRPVSQLSPAPCPAGTPTGVDCLHADVPLAAGGTAMARLLVARVAAPGSLAWRQPLLVLPDDPGSRSVTDLAGWRQVARQLGRDVVLVDRRGTGGSTPSLACPEADPTTLWVPSDKARADYLEGLAACRQRLVAAGTDPAAFGSTAAAADLEAVRAGLGVERWHVLAGRGSMGVAAALARSFPDTVASVTVDGSHTLAPGTDAVITADAIVAQVRADPALTAAWEGAVARAGQTPLRGKVDLAALQPGNRTPVPPGQWPTLAMDAAALRAALVAAAAHGDDLGAPGDRRGRGERRSGRHRVGLPPAGTAGRLGGRGGPHRHLRRGTGGGDAGRRAWGPGGVVRLPVRGGQRREDVRHLGDDGGPRRPVLPRGAPGGGPAGCDRAGRAARGRARGARRPGARRLHRRGWSWRWWAVN